jgi:tetratricopeptide (TPR) repeat protein
MVSDSLHSRAELTILLSILSFCANRFLQIAIFNRQHALICRTAALAVVVAGLRSEVHCADTFEAHQAQAVQALHEGRFAVAASEFEEAMRQRPNAPGIRKNAGLAFFQAKNYPKATELLSAARGEDPDDMQVLLALGTSLSRQNRTAEAQAVFADLLQRHPDSAQLHLLWGQVFASQSQDAMAEEEFRKALSLDPQMKDAHYNLGVLLLKQQHLSQAEDEFRAELLRNPENQLARFDLAVDLLRRNQKTAGIAELRKVLTVKPNDPDANYELGKALLDDGPVDAALPYLESAVRYGRNKVYGHYLLGRAYLKAGQQAKAAEQFSEVKRLRKQP